MTRARPTTGGAPTPADLVQEIVIESAGLDAQTGAQAIAPDHAPRAPIAPASLAQLAVPGVAPAGERLHEIEQLLYRQSELLDNKQWQAYIDLFTDDGMYWMPVSPDQTEWDGSPS
ncbi:MAG: aromatic-ring-hydroxylating dioxygenase subunit beta, partial [Kofleriaceae bacterium]